MAGKEKITEILNSLSVEGAQRAKKSDIIKEYLVIDVGTALIGIQVEYLREVFDIQDMNDVIRIPFSPQYILGIINVRGEIVPVLSFEQVLGLEESDAQYTKMVIIDEKFKIAFPVKDIVDLKSQEIKSLTAIKDIKRPADEQLFFQEFEYDGRKVIIVDVLKLYGTRFLI
jgi:chemotaxis signal transduction protein